MRNFKVDGEQVFRISITTDGTMVFTIKDQDTWVGARVVSMDKDTAASLAAYLLRCVAE